MSKKITTEQKTSLLDSYITRPRGMGDVAVLKAIKADVLKANTKGVSKASEADNWLYNQSMGVYRAFLSSRNSHLDMKGRKASAYSKAMRDLIAFIRSFQRKNGRPHADEDVLTGIKFIFANWDRLNDFHKNRIALPDIYDKIEEIIPMIKNGYDKKSATTNKIQQRKIELDQKRQARADDLRQ